MKTSLHFEAPGDLSVGTVRITGEGETIANWIATPDNRSFQQDDLKPGIYSAEIAPTGVAPQSVVFKIENGQANTVVLPTFSSLSSSGSNTSFFDSSNQQALSEVPSSLSDDILENQDAILLSEAIPETPGEGLGDPWLQQPIEGIRPQEKRRVSIGLSEEKNERESFGIFRGQSRMELFYGRLEIEIPEPQHLDPWAGNRVRLSISIERRRIERCLLPLYRGGTRITLVAPPFEPADLQLRVVPIDSKLRALLRTLDAGTSAEATAVRNDVLGTNNPLALLDKDADPWGAILVGLLAIRFPEIFRHIDPAWAQALTERAGWAFDAHVIRASQTLALAGDDSAETQYEAVSKAIGFLAEAQGTGSPYFRYTNQLFAEMAAGISDYLKMTRPDEESTALTRFRRLYDRWYRELPLQRGAGPTFTWLARDQAALQERQVLVPHRRPSGKLRPQDTLVIFDGQISARQITFIGEDPTASQSFAAERSTDPTEYEYAMLPAHERPPGPDDDPNKGRFGGEASRGGFHLTASFENARGRHLTNVLLTVEADRSENIALGDFVWFILHPTFSPAMLKVAFRGRRAQLRLQVGGRFTVGVWVPKAVVELERELSEIPVLVGAEPV
ncbi:pYEATS domain-containing protein [Bordetella sp. LUAb4]|uniref:pYEATS domain-containing protein n=1 Tax=Bordetella sp. LUAb4 TaxID=2843195 RepID=UPI001E35D370|nr:pYEATS domain-containing protein [Bordetella sp. LUAb4]